jgi:p-cumate 2,3-dioxygenase subunit alpha
MANEQATTPLTRAVSPIPNFAVGGDWHVAGHESEVPEPGDYVRRTVAGTSVLLVRGNDSEVRVFLNVCSHLGGIICRKTRDNVETFRCLYHGWTFNTKGELIDLPQRPYWGRTSIARHRR